MPGPFSYCLARFGERMQRHFNLTHPKNAHVSPTFSHAHMGPKSRPYGSILNPLSANLICYDRNKNPNGNQYWPLKLLQKNLRGPMYLMGKHILVYGSARAHVPHGKAYIAGSFGSARRPLWIGPPTALDRPAGASGICSKEIDCPVQK